MAYLVTIMVTIVVMGVEKCAGRNQMDECSQPVVVVVVGGRE